MSMNFSFDSRSGRGRIDAARTPSRTGDDTPFRLLVLADLSGRANRGAVETAAALAQRTCLKVDVDTLDDAPGRLGARVSVPVGAGGGSALELTFHTLEDFHPDRIVEQCPALQELRNLRGQLAHPATFESAAAHVRAWTAGSATDSVTPTTPSGGVADETPSDGVAGGSTTGTDDFASLLSKPAEQAGKGTTRPMSGSTGVHALLRDLVAPYVVPSPDPQRDDLIATVDRALGGQLAAILHDPHVQRLEAAWRGVEFLVSRVETDETLEIFLLDVSRDELEADLCRGRDIADTGLYRLVVEKTVHTPGAVPWSLLVSDVRFARTHEDARLLAHLACVAADAGAAILAGADDSHAATASLAAHPDPDTWAAPPAPDAWDALRASPLSAHVALALPRVLLRRPYGKGSDAIDAFDFDELGPDRPHEGYLWGTASFALAECFARAFRDGGWEIAHAIEPPIEDLPLHVFSRDGDREAQPTAEVLLTERAAERLASAGLCPLLSYRGQNRAQFFRLQSLANPACFLEGRWR